MKEFPYVLFTSNNHGYCKIDCSKKDDNEIWNIVLDVVRVLEKGEFLTLCDKEKFFKNGKRLYLCNCRFAVYLMDIPPLVLIVSIWNNKDLKADIAYLKNTVEEVLGVKS